MISKDFITKVCIKCPGEKHLSRFSPNKYSKDGLQSICKCCKTRWEKEYSRTKAGLIKKIYSGQRQSSKKRNYQLPNYTLNELREWALAQPMFHELFNAWVESGYSKMLSPSFDRTDDYQGYCLNRLAIMTWRENLDKSYSDRKNGINNKQSKTVVQSTLDGVFIDKYHSGAQASRETGVNHGDLAACCRGLSTTAGGFRWIYA